jgi:hypothetical protein
MRNRSITVAVILAIGLVVLLLSFATPVHEEMGWTDAVTGSTKRQTYVTSGFDMPPLMKTTPIIEPSPLAEWLARQEGPVTYDWRLVGGTLKTIWGKPVGHECGAAQPIFLLRCFLDQLVKSSSDKELRRFVGVMRHGTRQEQEAAVKAAVDKVLAAESRGGRKK